MTDLTGLEQRLTGLLAERAASASPPSDAWERMVAELSERPSAKVAAADEAPDLKRSLISVEI